MDDESARIIGFFFTYVLGGLFLGVMAARKNRSYWAWGVIGGLFWLPCIIAMFFLPPLCPKCERPLTSDEWKRRACPTCSSQT
jgi:prepilin signal peptidase PulO-like enzyme (type II secretory pathway)